MFVPYFTNTPFYDILCIMEPAARICRFAAEPQNGGIYMHLTIAICDDDPLQTAYLTSLVSDWKKTTEHTCTIRSFSSAESFLFEYAENRVWDILLLDIEMGEMNGVTLAKTVRNTNSTVQMIFITGFPDFIAEGYEVSALHYLMKPVSPDKLSSVLDRAVTNLIKKEKQLCITYDHQTVLVPLSQILYIEAQKQYVLIHTALDCYRMKCALSDMEQQLDAFFMKCQRSFIVNLGAVIRIKTDCVVLKNGTEIPISRGMADNIGKEIIRLF